MCLMRKRDKGSKARTKEVWESPSLTRSLHCSCFSSSCSSCGCHCDDFVTPVATSGPWECCCSIILIYVAYSESGMQGTGYLSC